MIRYILIVTFCIILRGGGREEAGKEAGEEVGEEVGDEA